jgi:hypothetical protein
VRHHVEQAKPFFNSLRQGPVTTRHKLPLSCPHCSKRGNSKDTADGSTQLYVFESTAKKF